MVSQGELFDLVDALLGEEPQLPPPAERARLREAAGMTQARLAAALKTSAQTVKNWENGRSEPRPPRLEAYQRVLAEWARRYPAHPAPPAPAVFAAPATVAAPGDAPPHAPASDPSVAASAPAAMPAAALTAPGGDRAAGSAAAPVPAPPAPAVVPAPVVPASGSAAAPVGGARQGAGVPRPAARATARGATGAGGDPRFACGPLLVLDGDGTAYGRDGLVLECPARTVAQLVDWTLHQAVGAPPLNRFGQAADPLVVLTAEAAVQLGLPERLEGHEQRASLRLPEDHAVVKQIMRAKWKLTRRGFGPWARIYRPAKNGQRQCVQLAIVSWGALDKRSWPGVADMEAPEIARVLTVYADRVLTPRGGTAVNGLELMTALRPPTRAVRDENGGAWISAHNPGSLGREPVDPAPPEAVSEHPLAQGWERGFLDEEVFAWVRDLQAVSGEEASMPFALGLDVTTAFLAAASRTPVGLSAPVHETRPRFDKKIPGSWFADLSHIELDPRLPNPFTPSGQRPEGPAWYQTHTLAYAVELGYNVEPLEAYLRPEAGAYLDPWHDRLKAAFLATMADLGVTTTLTDAQFLAAMERVPHGDPGLLAVRDAIKATAKGGIGKLRSRARGLNYVKGERWADLERPTWRPDIRAAVISKARVNMHRKMRHMSTVGLFPLAVLSDCVVYPAPTASALDLLPYTTSGKPLPGAFRLGITPGLVKVEGVQSMAWAVDLMEQGGNPAQLIKGGGHDAALDEGE
ncbi:helix-turn-helix transcriptional regulator [Streptomyces xanthochromogenes]|uniref:telomere-associated protein Tap n=1 Tax=Streptomyces xanthochromogenes TaxID=67384 RepID=UPI00343EECAD